MNNTQGLNWSDYIAIGALIISCIALFITWRQYARDRGSLKLDLTFHAASGYGTVYFINVVNSGRRPITLAKYHSKLKSGKVQTGPINIGKGQRLEEGESHRIVYSLNDCKDDITHPLDVKEFTVEDSIGNRYKIKTKTIAQDVKRQWTPEKDWLSKKREG